LSGVVVASVVKMQTFWSCWRWQGCFTIFAIQL